MNVLIKVGLFRAGKVISVKVLCKLPDCVFLQEANMGLLSEGSPLSWEETKKLTEHVRQHGVEQFINLFAKLRDRTGDVLKWGDEVCYSILIIIVKQLFLTQAKSPYILINNRHKEPEP